MENKSVSGKLIACALCLMLLAIPVLCQQQDAAIQARMDAERNVSGGTWLIIGIFLGLLGYVIALVSPPRAPASALIGKSPEYVAVYSEAYAQEGKRIQMRRALTGCLIGTGVQVAIVAAFLIFGEDYY